MYINVFLIQNYFTQKYIGTNSTLFAVVCRKLSADSASLVCFLINRQCSKQEKPEPELLVANGGFMDQGRRGLPRGQIFVF